MDRAIGMLSGCMYTVLKFAAGMRLNLIWTDRLDRLELLIESGHNVKI